MLAHEYNIIIDRGIVAPGHVREVVDGINTKKRFIPILLTNLQLPITSGYDTQMSMHTTKHKYDIILSIYFKNSLNHHVKIILLIKESIGNGPVNGSGTIVSIMFKTTKM